MAPGRVGRAMKPHDCASWLRGSLTAHPCADSELARIHSGHPAGLFCATSPPRNGMEVKSTRREALRKAAASRRLLWLVTYPPFPVGECWADQPPAGRARDRADWVAGAGMRLQHNPTSTRGPVRRSRMGDWRGAHLWPTFLCEEKGGAAGGSPAKRLTRLAEAVTRRMATRKPNPHPGRHPAGEGEQHADPHPYQPPGGRGNGIAAALCEMAQR